MKRNELTEFKNLSEIVILERVKNLKKELSDLLIDKNMNKLKDLKVISKKRKDLAQSLTVLRQKQLLSEAESKLNVNDQPEEKLTSEELKTEVKKVAKSKVKTKKEAK